MAACSRRSKSVGEFAVTEGVLLVGERRSVFDIY